MVEKFVKVAKLGERVEEVLIGNGETVGDVIRIAKMEIGGQQVRRNNVTVTLDEVVSDGDVLILQPQMKGGY